MFGSDDTVRYVYEEPLDRAAAAEHLERTVEASSVATTSPSSIHTLPDPRSPVMRRRPLFEVVERSRSTSGMAKVSRVPESATVTSEVDVNTTPSARWRRVVRTTGDSR